MSQSLKKIKPQNSKSRLQKGFTMVELIVVLSVIALLAILAVPSARGLIISGKVEPTGGDLNKVVTKIRSNFIGQGTTPYTALVAGGVGNAVFANTARGLVSTLTVTGANATATIQHDIGLTNANITIAPSTLPLGVIGDSFTVTLPTVNDAACPGLASQMAKAAEIITINATTVKAFDALYQGATAQNLCTSGDTNTFVFTFR